MEINKQKFSLAFAGTMGIVYIVCAVFVALWPNFALQLFGWLVHLVNVDKFAGNSDFTLTGLVIGLVQMLVYSYIAAYIFTALHNKFIKK